MSVFRSGSMPTKHTLLPNDLHHNADHVMKLQIADILIALFFLGWFILSILNQFGFAWFDKITRHDHFSLLPLWTFFAPNPGQSDYHLIYRDRKTDGSL